MTTFCTQRTKCDAHITARINYGQSPYDPYYFDRPSDINCAMRAGFCDDKATAIMRAYDCIGDTLRTLRSEREHSMQNHDARSQWAAHAPEGSLRSWLLRDDALKRFIRACIDHGVSYKSTWRRIYSVEHDIEPIRWLCLCEESALLFSECNSPFAVTMTRSRSTGNLVAHGEAGCWMSKDIEVRLRAHFPHMRLEGAERAPPLSTS